MLNRIIKLQKTKSRSITAFAKQLGMAQPTIDRQIKGAHAISIDLVSSIAKTYPDVSMEWLIRGNGPMLLDDIDTTTVVNTVHRVHADGDGAIINTGKEQIVDGGTTTINRLLDELAAMREQNSKLIEMLVKKS